MSNVGVFNPDQLILQGLPAMPTTATLAAGNHKRGTVLGQNSTTLEFHIWNPAANDGTEVASTVLFRDADATDAPVSCMVFVSGTLNTNCLHWPDPVTEAQKSKAFWDLRKHNILLETAAEFD